MSESGPQAVQVLETVEGNNSLWVHAYIAWISCPLDPKTCGHSKATTSRGYNYLCDLPTPMLFTDETKATFLNPQAVFCPHQSWCISL